MDYDVVIVGGGLTGLACGLALQESDLSYVILEAEERVGGRVRTDIVDGFRLDHGFQVLQTAYPEARRVLDYNQLNLQEFPAGVIVHKAGAFHPIADPRKYRELLFKTALSPVGGILDRLKMAKLAGEVTKPDLAALFQEKEQTTLEFLQDYGFSEKFIQEFFLPFFAGATLDRSLAASSRVLKYIFRVFADGDVTLPAKGMEEIPRQLASQLPSSRIQTSTVVESVTDGCVTLKGNGKISTRMIVLATSNPAMEKILGLSASRRSVSEHCLYFCTEWKPDFPYPFLVLNGGKGGAINNLAFPSLVAPDYSPDERTLISVVSLNNEGKGREEVEQLVRGELVDWFGREASEWQLLHNFHLQHALPDQQPPTKSPFSLPDKYAEGIRLCGEYQSLPGIQWALLSGRLTGEAIIGELT